MSKTHNTAPERVREIQERRRSGAAGKHLDKRSKRQRTRSAARRAAVQISAA